MTLKLDDLIKNMQKTQLSQGEIRNKIKQSDDDFFKSGEKEVSKRFNTNKASIFDAPIIGLSEVSKVGMYGRSKYDEFNWKKQTNSTELLDCIFRHFIKVLYGLDNASDSGCKEMAHLAWNALAYLEKELMGTLIDDRHKYPKEKIEMLESLLMLNSEQQRINIEEKEKKVIKGENK